MTTASIGSPEFARQETLSDSMAIELGRIVAEIADKKRTWAETSCQQRIELLDALIVSLGLAAEEWVGLSCQAKGHTPNTPPAGEEWLTGPSLVSRNLRLVRDSISQIAKTGKPKLPTAPTCRKDGQVVAQTFPTNLYDKLLFRDFTAEIWMDPEVSIDSLGSTMAVYYAEDAKREGSSCLVLCAGNISSIGPMDAIYKLFVESQVVILKMNPVNDYLTEPFKVAFAPLIDAGYLAIVKGGSATGKFLCEHESIDEIHITGSDKTHDAIVYGLGQEGVTRKSQRDPVCKKRVTSELGNVSPVIIIPGEWSKSEIAFQAENVASMLVNNAGFNCNSTRVLVTHESWPQRDEFFTALKKTFEQIPTRRAYYPGAAERHAAMVENREFTQTKKATEDSLPWTIVHVADVNDANEMCFNTEAFCSLMAETTIKAASVTDYIARAVQFANDRLWGTLNAGMIVSPKTLRQSDIARSVDSAVADLRYGTVAINHWPGLNFGLCSTTWGAFPGHPAHDIRSGSGVVHNTYMFDRPQKTVLRGPFKPFPKPVWFATHRRTHKVGKALYRFESAPSLLRLPNVLINAIG